MKTEVPHMEASMIAWEIRRRGRAWRSGEAMQRYQLTPEEIEMVKGKLFWSDEDRLRMLGLLLENVGVDAAVKLGDPKVWKDAIRQLDR
jgi:hypothetical protein